MNRPQTKRTPPKKTLRKIFSRVGSRRQRAATANAADFNDNSNHSIGRVLVVLLLLHIVAMAGLYLHAHIIAPEGKSIANTGLNPLSTQKQEHQSVQERINQTAVTQQLSADDKSFIHTCEPGDTYAIIANKYQVSEEQLRDLNASRGFAPGDSIRVPKSEPKLIEPARKAVVVTPGDSASGVTDSGETYKVNRGDTLSRIATEFGVSIEALMQLNGIDDPRKLRAEQTLKIPAR